MTYDAKTESQIAKLVSSKTARELAIGYLAARARESELESRLKVMGGISEIQQELINAIGGER